METRKSKISKIIKFMESQDYAVVSTINAKNKPESAVVAFSMPKALEVVFGTFNDTRKYKNLKRNPRIALVIGFKGKITIQYEGLAKEIFGSKLEKIIKCHLAKFPDSGPYVSDRRERFFKVVPNWIRHFDLYNPKNTFELVLT